MTTNPLAGLRDIHLPKAVSLWPPAPGWIILLSLCLILGVLLSLFIHRKLKPFQPKRASLLELNLIEFRYNKKHLNSIETAAALNQLLKRYCLAVYGRPKVARLYGTSWETFLGDKPFARTLSSLSYKKHSSESLIPVINDIREWIKEDRAHV